MKLTSRPAGPVPGITGVHADPPCGPWTGIRDTAVAVRDAAGRTQYTGFSICRRHAVLIRMKPGLLCSLCILCLLGILGAGCLSPPVKEPTVTVSDIAVSDLSLQAMTVNTTVVISNPNPVGAKLSKVAFDVWYFDDTGHYLGHGEQTGIAVKENGNTTVTIPVKIGTVPALQAVGSLVQRDSITLRVNGSAFIDLGVASYEKKFEQERVIRAGEFSGLLPGASQDGTAINVTEKVAEARGLWNALKGS